MLGDGACPVFSNKIVPKFMFFDERQANECEKSTRVRGLSTTVLDWIEMKWTVESRYERFFLPNRVINILFGNLLGISLFKGYRWGYQHQRLLCYTKKTNKILSKGSKFLRFRKDLQLS